MASNDGNLRFTQEKNWREERFVTDRFLDSICGEQRGERAYEDGQTTFGLFHFARDAP